MMTRIRKSCLLTKHLLGNLLAGMRGYKLTYIVEADAWSIQEDGKALTKALNTQKLIHARISTTTIGLRNQIIHFGSVTTFIKHKIITKPHPSNTLILTWFHVVPDDERLVLIKEAQKKLAHIHTSCESTKKILIQAGVDENIIIVISLGVDTHLFTQTSNKKKIDVRHQLNIPENRLVIGSFQKDGVGWKEGLEPKLIKGPDLFVETIKQLKDLNPFILLTGPSRGYVKQKLDEYGIEYKHVYLKTTKDLPKMYHALDVYLITSRTEGGPKSLLEAWASGVLVVSTPVGMVQDIATDGETVCLSRSEDVEHLANLTRQLLTDKKLQKHLTEQTQKIIPEFDWKQISQQYAEHLYETTSHRASIRK